MRLAVAEREDVTSTDTVASEQLGEHLPVSCASLESAQLTCCIEMFASTALRCLPTGLKGHCDA